MSQPEYEDDTTALEGEDEEEFDNENFDSFQALVWHTFRLINISEDQISTKKVKYKDKASGQDREYSLDYISWATAWGNLMECFPESHVEFGDPAFFADGTGEQWVTVRIIQGKNYMVRRWFLPYMDHKNAAVVGPSSLQINNTRMRCFTKVMALCGLGLDVYGGEDIPDQRHDEVVSGRSKSVRQELLDEMQLSEEEWATVSEWAEVLREIAPHKDDINQQRLLEWYLDTSKLKDITVALYQKLESWQRTAITKIRNEVHEKERKEAVDKIQDQ